MRGASETTWKRMKTDDAKGIGSRRHHEITLLRICLLCTTNWFSSLFDLRRCQERRTVCPYNRNEKLTRGSWNNCHTARSWLFTFREYRKFLHRIMRNYSRLFVYARLGADLYRNCDVMKKLKLLKNSRIYRGAKWWDSTQDNRLFICYVNIRHSLNKTIHGIS